MQQYLCRFLGPGQTSSNSFWNQIKFVIADVDAVVVDVGGCGDAAVIGGTFVHVVGDGDVTDLKVVAVEGIVFGCCCC